MSRLPIRLRVTLVFTASMALLLAGLIVFVRAEFSGRLDETVDVALRTRVDEVTAAVGESRRALSGSSRGALAEPEESYAQLLGPSGDVIDATSQVGATPLLGPADIADLLVSDEAVIELDSVPGVEGRTRAIARRVDVAGRPAMLVVGASLDDRDEAIGSLTALLAGGGAAALALASLAGWVATGLALRPVEAIRSRAAAVSPDRPGERLPVPRADDELRRLAETLNLMLDRLAAGIERERAFVDDASHELRTPLALQRTGLEVALRYANDESELREAIRGAISEADRLGALADDMLISARAQGREIPVSPERLALADLFEQAASRFGARAAADGRRITVQPTTTHVRADPVRVGQILTNLIDNALRHGAGDVRLSAERQEQDRMIRIVVRDEGEGLPPGFEERAFERFTRADPARARGGAGLGLAIVAAIAAAHGGRAGVERRSAGAGVWVELPWA